MVLTKILTKRLAWFTNVAKWKIKTTSRRQAITETNVSSMNFQTVQRKLTIALIRMLLRLQLGKYLS